jgi:hypothetical protein
MRSKFQYFVQFLFEYMTVFLSKFQILGMSDASECEFLNVRVVSDGYASIDLPQCCL